MDLKISNLKVSIEGKKIIHGISLSVAPGEVHAIMGPNGSGKSTFAFAVAGHPQYKINRGKITLGKKTLTGLPPHERARKGIFLGFQNPVAIPGVAVGNFLRTAKYSNLSGRKPDVMKLQKELIKTSQRLNLGVEFLDRFLNDGFSGGERKKAEMLQLVTLAPKFAILDEIDTGLDIDALKIIASVLKGEVKKGMGLVLITHYCRIFNYIKPDCVHILKDGGIFKSGGFSIAQEVERKGYEKLTL